MKGFIKRALKRWQIENKIKLDDIVALSPAKLLKSSKQINDCVIKELTRVLIDPSQKPELEKAANEILEFVNKYQQSS